PTNSNADVTTTPASLTFTTDNWDTAQTVTVNAAEDDDGIQDTATLRMKATDGGYDNVAYEEVVVTVRENDPLGLTVSKSALTVGEGSNGTFTVNLDTQPSASVTVNITQKSGTANTDVTVSQASLTFTTGNWRTAQTVTVNAAEDDDGIGDSTTLVVGATSGGYDNVADKEVAVTVTENDTLGITVSKTTLTVGEGSNGTFTVNLDTQPSASVTVNITQKTGTDNTDVTVSQASLTFTTGNWRTAQTVTVDAAEDDDGIKDSTTLVIGAAGGGYDSVTAREVEVTVTENDSLGITVSKSALTVGEGSTGTFTVNLDTRPSDEVTVSITRKTGTANDDVSLSLASLTFTTGNWRTTQEVTVNAAEDDDGIQDSTTLVIGADGGGYDNVADQEVVVTVTENDPLGITVSKSALTVGEGSNGTFTVNLDTQPSASVTVSVTRKTGTANTDVTLSSTSLTFTTGNWGTAQTVTVNAAEDDDGINDSTTLVIGATSGGYDSVADREVVVTVTENDPLGLTVSVSTLTVDEGSTGTFTVNLDTEPSASVMVDITRPSNADVTTTPTSLTFTTDNWDTPRTVTVNAAEDDDGIQDSLTLRMKATGGGYDSVARQDVVVTVRENDSLGITVSKSALTVGEGSTGTFTVELDTQPSASMTVNITQPDNANADVTTTPASLTFTTGNWDTAQTVTVNAADDSDADNDSATLRVKAIGGGYGLVAHEEVVVTVNDNDTRGLALDPTSLSITEGEDDRFEVMLTTLPSGNVKVTLSQAGSADSDMRFDTDDSAPGDQNELTFTTADWNQARTVTVNTGQDNDLTNDIETLTLTASGADYAGVSDT
ncbi:MAG: hypothetical protein ISN28_07365, partial [Ectothiorhodospiraceae bacterium AqS1]|nr:hypothetical protein [Ectothiorhodospiraceae bacterium AqS1]